MNKQNLIKSNELYDELYDKELYDKEFKIKRLFNQLKNCNNYNEYEYYKYDKNNDILHYEQSLIIDDMLNDFINFYTNSLKNKYIKINK